MRSNDKLLFRKESISDVFFPKIYALYQNALLFILISCGINNLSAQTIDLSLQKQVNQSSITSETFIFGLTVKNEGTTTAKQIKIKDTKPYGAFFISASPSTLYNQFTGCWTIDSIPAGETIYLEYTIRVLEEGVINSEAEVQSMQGIDIDSTTNNGVWTEDDYSSACISTPYRYCKKSAINLEVSAPDGLSNYQWFKNDTLIAQTQLYTITDFGKYYYKAQLLNSGCDVELCCPIEVAYRTQPIVLHPTITQKCGFEDQGKIAVFAEFGVSPIQYDWSNGVTTASVQGLINGNYTVTVTDVLGCTAIGEYNINQCCNVTNVGQVGYDELAFSSPFDPAPIVEIQPATGGTGQIYYIWVQSLNGINWSTIPGATGTTYDPPNINETRYYRRCVRRADCDEYIEGNIIKKEIKIGCNLTHSLQKNDISCKNTKGSIAAIVAGGTAPYSYKWSNGETTSSINNLNAVYYELTVTDSNGCTSICGLKILNTASNFTINKTCTAVTCYGGNNGTASVSVLSGGKAPFSYKWNNGLTSSNISLLKAGTYTVTVMDSNGCSKTASVPIPQPNQIVITAVKKDVSCYGIANGTISTAVSGGISPYTYKWSNAMTTPNIIGLSPNIYTLSITDTKGCSNSKSVPINQPSDISLTITKTDAKCNAAADGNAKVIAMGGVKPYTYAWNIGNTTNTVYSLNKGIYKVTITDANACKKETSISIAEPPALIATIQNPISNCINGVKIIALGGIPPYKYSKDGKIFQTNPIFCNLPNGTTTLTTKDAKGCLFTNTVQVGTGSKAGTRGSEEVVYTAANTENASIVLYPNPTDDILFIKTENINLHQGQLIIIDLLGTIVKNQPLNENASNLMQIEVNALPSGIYQLLIIDTQKNHFKQQFIVVK